MNKFINLDYLIAMLIVLVIFIPVSAQSAVIPNVYTDDNFVTSYHDKPLFFQQDAFGNFSGVTESGKTFTQVQITNSFSIRLQKFSIDEVSFYISDKGIINAKNDLAALSMYLIA